MRMGPALVVLDLFLDRLEVIYGQTAQASESGQLLGHFALAIATHAYSGRLAILVHDLTSLARNDAGGFLGRGLVQDRHKVVVERHIGLMEVASALLAAKDLRQRMAHRPTVGMLSCCGRTRLHCALGVERGRVEAFIRGSRLGSVVVARRSMIGEQARPGR